MMYKNKLICVLKDSNGKILREYGDIVYLPFGSEYSLSFKNLETRKAITQVFIDGQDVLNGYSLILDPGREIPLERFVSDLNKGNKFKFIQKTEEISEFRGDKIDDGVIRITFRFEKVVEYVPIRVYPDRIHLDNKKLFRRHDTICIDTGYGDIPGNTFFCNSMISDICNSISSDNGITVKGNISNQAFETGYIGSLEEISYSMIFNLKGINKKNIRVNESITIDTKIQCDVCGRTYRSGNKFCPNCGNSLM